MNYKKTFEAEIAKGLCRMPSEKVIIKESDITHLPVLLQNYLKITGFTGSERISNMYLKFRMKLRSKPNSDWMNLKVTQYSFFDIPTRLFYIKARMMGIPATGLHKYINGEGTMNIKAFSLIPLVNASGSEMNTSETVTFFNDMCILAPQTLINPSILWTETGKQNVRGEFEVNGINISAELEFNNDGYLTNFTSYNRYCYMPDGSFQKFRFSTPVKNFRDYNGFLLPSYGEAIWGYPEGDFCYATFDLEEVIYNKKEL